MHIKGNKKYKSLENILILAFIILMIFATYNYYKTKNTEYKYLKTINLKNNNTDTKLVFFGKNEKVFMFNIESEYKYIYFNGRSNIEKLVAPMKDKYNNIKAIEYKTEYKNDSLVEKIKINLNELKTEEVELVPIFSEILVEYKKGLDIERFDNYLQKIGFKYSLLNTDFPSNPFNFDNIKNKENELLKTYIIQHESGVKNEVSYYGIENKIFKETSKSVYPYDAYIGDSKDLTSIKKEFESYAESLKGLNGIKYSFEFLENEAIDLIEIDYTQLDWQKDKKKLDEIIKLTFNIGIPNTKQGLNLKSSEEMLLKNGYIEKNK